MAAKRSQDRPPKPNLEVLMMIMMTTMAIIMNIKLTIMMMIIWGV